MIAQIVGAFIMLLIAVSLYPAISNQINLLQNESISQNITQPLLTPHSQTLLKSIPIIFILTTVGICIFMVYKALTSSDEIEIDEDSEETEEYRPNAKVEVKVIEIGKGEEEKELTQIKKKEKPTDYLNKNL